MCEDWASLPAPRLLRQEGDTCGQTCVAMLTGAPPEEVCHGLGNWGGTFPQELAMAVRAHSGGRLDLAAPHPAEGDTCPPVAYRVEDVVPLVPLAVVHLEGPPGREGHAVLWVLERQGYLDPYFGELEAAAALNVWGAHGYAPKWMQPVVPSRER